MNDPTLLARLRRAPRSLARRVGHVWRARQAEARGDAWLTLTPEPPDRTLAEGLVRLDVRFALPASTPTDDGGCWLEADSDDGRRCTIELDAAALDAGLLRLALASPLLADGRRRLRLALWRGRPGAGRRLAQAQWICEVHNPSPLAAAVRASLGRHGAPWLVAGDLDARLWPYDDAALVPWFDRPDAQAHIDELAARGRIDARERGWLEQFVRDGFLVAEGLIDAATVAAVNAEFDAAVRAGFGGYRYGTSARIRHLHLHYPAIRALWQDVRWLRLVDLIFGGRALPCQTLGYLFGSEQDAHQDTIHLTPFPAGMMCGTWIALQDIEEGSGELVVYPGSHREPRLTMHGCGCAKVRDDAAPGAWDEFGAKVVPRWAEMAARYPPWVYRPKQGTVLIWHENLLHGGSPRRDAARERRSLVIHSFAEGALAFYDSSGAVGTTLPARDRRDAAPRPA